VECEQGASAGLRNLEIAYSSLELDPVEGMVLSLRIRKILLNLIRNWNKLAIALIEGIFQGSPETVLLRYITEVTSGAPGRAERVGGGRGS